MCRGRIPFLLVLPHEAALVQNPHAYLVSLPWDRYNSAAEAAGLISAHQYPSSALPFTPQTLYYPLCLSQRHNKKPHFLLIFTDTRRALCLRFDLPPVSFIVDCGGSVGYNVSCWRLSRACGEGGR
jgi:hypothetical protein